MSEMAAKDTSNATGKNAEWDATKEQQHRARAELILKAAAECLNERGYEGTSLSRIAKKLSMTNGALYYYFDSKTELAFACLMATQARVRDCLLKGEQEGETGLQMVEAFVVAMIEANAAHRSWVLSGAPYFLSSEQAREYHEAATENVNHLAKLISTGVSDKSVRPSEPMGTALMILSSLNFQNAASPFASAVSVSVSDMTEVAKLYVTHSLARLV